MPERKHQGPVITLVVVGCVIWNREALIQGVETDGTEYIVRVPITFAREVQEQFWKLGKRNPISVTVAMDRVLRTIGIRKEDGL